KRPLRPRAAPEARAASSPLIRSAAPALPARHCHRAPPTRAPRSPVAPHRRRDAARAGPRSPPPPEPSRRASGLAQQRIARVERLERVLLRVRRRVPLLPREPEAALSAGEEGEGIAERLGVEVGPHDGQEVELGVGGLEEEEVA